MTDQGADAMPKCPRRNSLRARLLAGAIGCLVLTGCSDRPPPASPESEQYKEAKKRGDAARAKEYGRRSIDEKKATLNQPEPKGR
jgi:hypothetical protein